MGAKRGGVTAEYDSSVEYDRSRGYRRFGGLFQSADRFVCRRWRINQYFRDAYKSGRGGKQGRRSADHGVGGVETGVPTGSRILNDVTAKLVVVGTEGTANDPGGQQSLLSMRAEEWKTAAGGIWLVSRTRNLLSNRQSDDPAAVEWGGAPPTPTLTAGGNGRGRRSTTRICPANREPYCARARGYASMARSSPEQPENRPGRRCLAWEFRCVPAVFRRAGECPKDADGGQMALAPFRAHRGDGRERGARIFAPARRFPLAAWDMR